MRDLKLFALAVDEITLLSKLLADKPANKKLRDYLRSGGFDIYAGVVTDQDGDACWHLSANQRRARKWVSDMDEVCFVRPKVYKIGVRRNGLGPQEELRCRIPNSRP
jgi:hypothetical protein